MLVILSPAKTMKSKLEFKQQLGIPTFLKNTKEIVTILNSLSIEELKEKMKINDKIAKLNMLRYKELKFDDRGMPALLAYDGLQYKSMKAENFDKNDMDFACKHIRILSAMYGVLKPLDSIYEYRLEMQAKIQLENAPNLYKYWDDKIYKEVTKESMLIINLASNEYSKTIEKFLDHNIRYITCSFKVNKGGKLKVESTQAKMARGRMVNYIVKNRIEDATKLKEFDLDGYVYSEELSNENEYVFVLCKNE